MKRGKGRLPFATALAEVPPTRPVSVPRVPVMPAARTKLPCDVQLCLVIDRTGSSGKFKLGIPESARIIANYVTTKARSTVIWVISYGDYEAGQQEEVHLDGGTPEQAIEAIKKIEYGGGGEIAGPYGDPENHLDAVEFALGRVPWTSDPTRSRGCIILFSSSESHKARSGATATQIGEQVKGKGVLLYLISEPTPLLQELAAAGGGLIFQITNTPDPTELQKIAAPVAASIAASLTRGSTLPMGSGGNDAQVSGTASQA